MIARKVVFHALNKNAFKSFTLRGKHTLPELRYPYNGLEPHITKEVMEIHHGKHHQAYVNNLNLTEEKLEAAIEKNDISTQFQLQSALKFNMGGHINHSFFWENLAPTSMGGGVLPKGTLLEMINRDFGSLEKFIEKFNAITVAIQGSGWGWLGYNTATRKLEIVTTANQEFIYGLAPLLTVDVWEHAYYLQYKNLRPDFLKKVWNVIDWNTVQKRFDAATKAK